MCDLTSDICCAQILSNSPSVLSQFLMKEIIYIYMVIPELTDAATQAHTQISILNNCHYCEAVKLTNRFVKSF